MELTIKELVAYLPYGLKVQHIEPISFLMPSKSIEVLESVSDECCTFKSSSDWYFDFEENDCDIKPILYPLDFLTKEITHNGETFVPIEWLEEKYYTLNYRQQCLRLLDEDGHNWINQTDYMLVEQLIEWKLDIFNLIENNLAIAVTEDFNPYK